MKRCVGCLLAALALLVGAPAAFAEEAPAGATLETGGLKPPDAIPSQGTSPPPSAPEAQLDRADKEDSGRGLEFVWLNADVGAEYLGLETLKANQLVDGQFAKSKQAGVSYGAGAGVRLLAFTVGARFRFANFSAWQLWTLDAEGGMHIPLGRLEPYFTVGAGYASLGFDDSKVVGTPNDAHGLDVRGGAGLDYYLTNTFTVGANLSGEFLFLGRGASSAPPLPAGTPQQNAAAATYASHGSGIGLGGTFSVVLGLHF